MANDDIKDTIYNEQDFLFYKEKMKNDWMKEPINQAELDKNLSVFFLNLYEDYSQNCLLIGLLQFQCQCEKIGSSFIVPFYNPRRFSNLEQLVNDFKRSTDTQKFIKFFEKKSNPLINFYFWNITFPNIFGSFFSQEFCEAAFNFLTKFKDNAKIFSKGVISFISHNYLFQNSFLNTFYTLLNRSYENEKDPQSKFYGWCQYDQSRYEQIIQTALIEALKQLNSHQIMALNLLIDNYQQEAADLIYTDIIIYNLKYVWPYSSYFLPTGMISNIDEYINNQQSSSNQKALLDKFFQEAKKLTIKDDFKMSDLVSMKESFIVTNLDLIIMRQILDSPISTNYPNFEEDLTLFNQIKDHQVLIDFMLNRCFKYHKLEIVFSHTIFPENFEKIKNFDVLKKWQNHEEECKLRNENPLAVIFNNQPIDKNVAFYGLYTSYHQRLSLNCYKEKLTQKMGFLIPLQKSIEIQNSMIDMSSLRLSKLIDHIEFPDSLILIYVNHIKSLIFTFSMESLIRNSELVPLFERVFKETFTKQYESELLLRIKEFTLKKDSSSILLDFSGKFFNELNKKFVDSIPDDTNLNGKNKQQICMEHKKRKLRLADTKCLSLEFVRKIEYAFSISSFLNTPQKFEYKLSSENDNVNFSGLKNIFDEFDENGVFSYIESVCYRLLSENQNESKLNVGTFLFSVPTILKMIRQFFYKDDDGELIVHPFISRSCKKVTRIEFVADCAFKYSLFNEKMTVYKDLIEEYKNGKINALLFFIKLVDFVANFIKENKYNELFSSIQKIYEKINELKSFL